MMKTENGKIPPYLKVTWLFFSNIYTKTERQMDKAKSCGHFPTGSNVDNFWQFVRKAEYKELSTL